MLPNKIVATSIFALLSAVPEKLIIIQLVKKFTTFLVSGVSLPCLHKQVSGSILSQQQKPLHVLLLSSLNLQLITAVERAY
jgi:hypothetical protein